MSFHDAAHAAVPTWSAALDAFIRSRLPMPFSWGHNDCCLFAADAVQAMTGQDLAAAERGTYATASEALELVQRLGGLQAIADRAGQRVPPLTAQRGDIGLVSVNGRDLLAVCLGPYWVAPTGGGLAPIALADARMAWRVARG